MASKADLERDVRQLRQQMAALDKRCQEREDKLIWVLETIEPFIDVMTYAQKEALEGIKPS